MSDLEPTVLRLHLWLENDKGVALGLGRAKLLAKIAEHGSLKAAAEDLGISYRAAWGKIKRTQEVLGVKLVDKPRGNREGLILTDLGRNLAEQWPTFFASVERFALDEARRLLSPSISPFSDNTSTT